MKGIHVPLKIVLLETDYSNCSVDDTLGEGLTVDSIQLLPLYWKQTNVVRLELRRLASNGIGQSPRKLLDCFNMMNNHKPNSGREGGFDVTVRLVVTTSFSFSCMQYYSRKLGLLLLCVRCKVKTASEVWVRRDNRYLGFGGLAFLRPTCLCSFSRAVASCVPRPEFSLEP